MVGGAAETEVAAVSMPGGVPISRWLACWWQPWGAVMVLSAAARKDGYPDKRGTAGRFNGANAHPRAHLYNLDQLAAAPRGNPQQRIARHSTLPDTDTSVECLSCGGRYRNLGSHLARTHGLTADEYRAEHRLPRGTALMATSTASGAARRRPGARRR